MSINLSDTMEARIQQLENEASVLETRLAVIRNEIRKVCAANAAYSGKLERIGIVSAHAAFRCIGGEVTASALATEAGITLGNAYAWLSRATKRGLIRRVSAGRYVLTDVQP